MSHLDPVRSHLGSSHLPRRPATSITARYPRSHRPPQATPMPPGQSMFDLPREQVHTLSWVERTIVLWKEEHPDRLRLMEESRTIVPATLHKKQVAQVANHRDVDSSGEEPLQTESSPALSSTSSFQSAGSDRCAACGPSNINPFNQPHPAAASTNRPNQNGGSSTRSNRSSPSRPRQRRGNTPEGKDVSQKTLTKHPDVTYTDLQVSAAISSRSPNGDRLPTSTDVPKVGKSDNQSRARRGVVESRKPARSELGGDAVFVPCALDTS